MPPVLASLLCTGAIIGMILWDRDPKNRVSLAIWIPVIWISIGASRAVSEWIGGTSSLGAPEQFLEGSPLDRNITFVLLVLALSVLLSRGERSSAIVRANIPILMFLLYCCLTSLWSDFPFVTFKRWTKGFGNVVMVFVVLSDPNPTAAVKRLFARVGFLLVPVSVLFIKYYPGLGRGYDSWTGASVYTGVTTNKNSLGCLCLVCGLSTLWLFLGAWSERSERPRQLLIHGTMLIMVLWLFVKADSATSLGCFLLGATAIVFFNVSKRRATTIHWVLGTSALVVVLAYASLDAQTYALEAFGRDATLTGRTELWKTLLQMDTAPWFGSGFESFFLGERLTYLWAKYWWRPNEAHSGYLEMYLTLGWVGVSLVVLLAVAGYRHILSTYRRDPRFATIMLAFWIVAIIYNLTEAAVKVMHPVWIAFLLAVTTVPTPAKVATNSHTSVARRVRATTGRSRRRPVRA